MRQKLLLISYQFPPAGGIGVQRALSLARYLPQCGFEVHVLRARNPVVATYDPALLRRIPETVTIHQAFTPELPFELRQKLWKLFSGGGRPAAAAASAAKTGPGRFSSLKRLPATLARRIFNPEPEVVWVPFALRQARRIVKRHGIDSVIVTAPPFSSFLIGNALKKEFPHITLVSDFRDDWLRFYIGEFKFQQSAAIRRRAEQIERRTVELSDRVVVVTDGMLRDIRARYPDIDSRKFDVVPNGYDSDAFAGFTDRSGSNGRVVVGHIGTVYSAASARYFLDAADNLPDGLRSRIEARFVGRIAADEQHYFEGRRTAIQTLGFLPQAQALREMEQSDYLLVTMTDAASLTGKIFEYLATGKPIIAVAQPGGEVARLVERTGAGWCVAPSDGPGLTRLLTRLLDPAGGDAPHAPNWDAIREFDRSRLTARVADLIRSA